MSKTDKTQPYWVKVREKHEYLQESHDHRDGVCDLPERPRPGNSSEYNWSRPWQSGRCQWVVTPVFWSSGYARCACWMCSYDAFQSVPRRKRQRIDGKKYCQDGWRDEY